MNDVSEKSVQENYFNQYRSMIENAAWKASRIFRMDVEDLRFYFLRRIYFIGF